MRQVNLRQRLANFIKDKRGDESVRAFALRHGLTKDTIRRIEDLDQNVTIDTLEEMCKKFRCDIDGLFPKQS